MIGSYFRRAIPLVLCLILLCVLSWKATAVLALASRSSEVRGQQTSAEGREYDPQAGAVQLPRTGQTTSFSPGDDGDLQVGVIWPSPRFEDHGDGTITDLLTGLMWAQDLTTPSVDTCSGGPLHWAEALAYVSCLNSVVYLGYDDWHLPNALELDSVLSHTTVEWLEGQGFLDAMNGYYTWSSTTDASNPDNAWSIQLYGLHPLRKATMKANVWPVRSTGLLPPAQLWRTGQTAVYAAGDDGDNSVGFPWPEPRFEDNGDGTVGDRLTGLTWLKDANCMATHYPDFDLDGVAGDGAVTWQHALDFVAAIDQEDLPACGAGHSDWRLPNRKELRSLTDFSQFGPSLPAGHPFTNVQAAMGHQAQWYWSSTKVGNAGNVAFTVFTYGGHESVIPMYADWEHYVWPVRSGQQLSPSLPIEEGDVWRYIYFLDSGGETPPPSNWHQIGFDDSGWSQGPSGIGYDDDDDKTLVPEGTVSVYARREFYLEDPSTLSGLRLTMDYDDGFVAYLNGAEVARGNMPSGSPDYDTLANPCHEASRSPDLEATPQPALMKDLDSADLDRLVPGINVLAVQVHNCSEGSTDLTGIPTLVEAPPLENWPPLPIVEHDVWRYVHFMGTADETPPPDTWHQTGFDDSGWSQGPSGIGYDDSDDETSVPEGTVSVYARRGFYVEDPGALSGLRLTIDYDDGFVAYLNGIEIARRNMPSGSPDYATLANPCHEASGGDTDPQPPLQLPLGTDQLVSGNNVLAVQVHNCSPTSSDLSMIPELAEAQVPTAPVEGPPLPIVEHDVWRYVHFMGTTDETPPPDTWHQIGFDDSGWSQGPSGIGYDDSDDETSVPEGTVSVYARRGFYVEDPGALSGLRLTMDYDDGFVAYLNGMEVARRNMPSGSPDYATLANPCHEASGGDTDPQPPLQLPLGTAQLVSGNNVLAIQVHNCSPTSSDLSMIPELHPDMAIEVVKGPYLQNVTLNSIVVMWETDVQTPGKVRYRLQDGAAWTEVSGSGEVTIHEVTIHGLEPNTLYNYQVSRDGSGLWLPATPVVFVTAPEANTFFRVAVYGDSRSYPEDHTRVIQSTIDDDPSIVLHTGDIVYYGKNYAGWGPQFFEPAAALIVDTPLFPSPGNHEFLSEGEPDHLWYYDLFSLPGNEKWYAFTYGCARFIALDTNADFTTGTSQHNWLIDELASADYNTAKWHFVFTHYPFYTSGPHPSNERPVLALVEKFEEFDVDMVFSGHNHNYERSLKDGVNYIVTGGGGAELRGFTLDNPYSQVRKNTHHHITLDVSCSGTEQVKMTAWDDDQNGNQFDQVVLHRDVQIAEGTALALRSDASVAGDWINEGAFLHGFHRIDLVGNQQHTIGGSVPTVFYDLTVNRGARVVIPVANTPLIEGTLENNGVLQQTAEVGPDKTVEFLQIDGDKYRGLRITTDAGNSLGSTTARVASSEFCPVAPGLPGDPVKRCYEVLPTAITNNTAAIRLYYRPDEAGDGMPHVNDPDSLAIYRLSGGSWHLVHGAYTRGADGGAYDWVQVSGVHEYGWFMLANAYPLHLPAIFRDGQGTH